MPNLITTITELERWLTALPTLREHMDLWFGRHPKEEREVQQLLVADNNFRGPARATDYYLCDIEYAYSDGQLDFVGVHWPSTPVARKDQTNRRLVVGEIKLGAAALEGDSGLREHVESINNLLSDPSQVAALKDEMRTVFNQKRALGLIHEGRSLEAFSDERPLLLFVLVNQDPAKSGLARVLQSLPKAPQVDIRIATSRFMGYGLFDPCLRTVPENREDGVS